MSELIEPDIEPKKLRPVILTCDKRLGIFKKFVDSYKQVADSMLQPIVLAQHWHEETREEYDALIQELNPHKVVEQSNYYYYDRNGNKSFYNKEGDGPIGEPRDTTLNVQEFVVMDFPRIALEYSKDNEDFIWIEDDAIFSSQFPQAINRVGKYLSPDFSFVTLFCTNHTTRKDIPFNDFIHAVEDEYFHTTVCVIFNRKRILDFLQNREVIKSHGECWDVRWKEYMRQQDLKIYATKLSYVQQQEGLSVLKNREWDKGTDPISHSKQFVE
jgi:hypothetical protein